MYITNRTGVSVEPREVKVIHLELTATEVEALERAIGHALYSLKFGDAFNTISHFRSALYAAALRPAGGETKFFGYVGKPFGGSHETPVRS